MTEKEKKEDISVVSYTLGIVSVVLAFFLPLGGFVFGVVGFIQSKKQKTLLYKKAKKLNLIGMILSLALFIISIVANMYFINKGFSPLQNFPSG